MVDVDGNLLPGVGLQLIQGIPDALLTTNGRPDRPWIPQTLRRLFSPWR